MMSTAPRLGLSFSDHAMFVVEVRQGSGGPIVTHRAEKRYPFPVADALRGALNGSTDSARAMLAADLSSMVRSRPSRTLSIALPTELVFMMQVPVDPVMSEMQRQLAFGWEVEQHLGDRADRFAIQGYRLTPTPGGDPTADPSYLIVSVERQLIDQLRLFVGPSGKQLQVIDIEPFAVEHALQLYPTPAGALTMAIGYGHNHLDINVLAGGGPTALRHARLDNEDDGLYFLSAELYRQPVHPSALWIYGTGLDDDRIERIRQLVGDTCGPDVAVETLAPLPGLPTPAIGSFTPHHYTPSLGAALRQG